MPNYDGSFIWYELMTTDMAAAQKFYAAVVGWKISDAFPNDDPDGIDYRMVVRSDGGNAGGALLLSKAMCDQGARPTWIGYLSVKNVDAACAAIAADGGRLLMPKRVLPVGEIAMVADPLGTPFYVMSAVPPPDKPAAVSDVFDPNATERVNWNELATTDLQRAKAFYAKHFGYEFNESMPMGELGDYCFVDHHGVRLGAVMPKPTDSPLSGWLFYFGVASIAQAKRAIEQGGGKVLMEPHEVPGGSWIVVALDPQGAPFGVVGPRGE